MAAADIARRGVGYVPQGRGIFAGMTVAENLSLGRLARATDGSQGVVWSEAEILEMFPVLKDRYHTAADYLSGGEQQMLAVARALRSEEHTSELQSLMRISYAVFCLKKKKIKLTKHT